MALTTVPASLSATALTLTTAAQPNITSVGTLTGLTVSGNIAGTLTTAAQTNITSVGTLSSLSVGAITSTGKLSLNDSTYAGWIQSNGSVRIDIDNDNNQTDRAFIVSKNNGATSLLTIYENTSATFAGAITANAGVVVDNITIDGTEIDLSSGDLTLDVAGNISLDADDGGHVRFKDGGTQYASIYKSGSGAIIDTPSGGDITLDSAAAITLDADSGVIDFDDGGTNIGRIENASSDFKLESRVQDKDIVLIGNDGGVGVEALRLDMSAAGNVQARRARNNTAGQVALSVQPSDSTIHYGFRIDSSSNSLNLDRADSGNEARLVTVNAAGNVGIGVTPSAHYFKTLEIGTVGCAITGRGAADTHILSGLYWDGNSTRKYAVSGVAVGTYQITNGIHYWSSPASGTAGNTATVSANMTLNASGNLGIGNTNPSAGKLVITASSNGSFGGNLILENSNASDTDKVAIALRPNGSATTALGSYGEIRIIGEYDSGSTNGASNLQFWTHSGNGTVAEAMRIGSTGHVAIGANPDLTKFIVEADHANWAGRFRNTNAGAYGLSVDLSQSSAAGGQANVYAFATYTPANTGLVITKNGSVGIRTATPGSYGLNILGNDNQVVIDGNGSSANSGLFFAEQGTNKWEVYHRGTDDTFRIYNYATSSPNLQISAAGAVTHEKQPFSQGRGAGGWTSQTSAANWTKHPLTTPSMRTNRGSHYSTTNKRFTAPVAGVYLIQASWYAYYPGGGDSGGSQYMHPAVYINGGINWNGGYQPYTIYGHDIFDTTSHYLAPTLSLSVYLSENDYAEIFVYSRDSDLDFYENYSYFSFQLIG